MSHAWRASPESWHLSQVIIIQLSNIHNNTCPGNNCLSQKTLSPGMSRPGKAPTSAKKTLSPGVCLARGKHPHPVRPKSSVPVAHRVSVTSSRTGLASGKLPTRLRWLPCAPTGSYRLNTQVWQVSHLM